MDLYLFTLFFHQSQVSHIFDSQFNASDDQIQSVTSISEFSPNEIGVSFASWNLIMISSALE